MRTYFIAICLLLLVAFTCEEKKVIAAYSKISSFEACGKQEIILFKDSTYMYRVFFRKNENQRIGKYQFKDGNIIFSNSRKRIRKMRIDNFQENLKIVPDSVSFNGKFFYKTNKIGPPCIYRGDNQ